MEKHWLEEMVAALPGAEAAYKEEWGAWLYRVGGKMFGMRGGYKDGRPILTLKLPPEQGDFLRRQYEYVIPGYYMNKTHYNSIFLDACGDEEFLRGLVKESYTLVLGQLTKKARLEIEQRSE